MLTEKKLVQAFDQAEFSGHAKLGSLIKDTLNRTAAIELSDDEVEAVAAAGRKMVLKEPDEL